MTNNFRRYFPALILLLGYFLLAACSQPAAQSSPPIPSGAPTQQPPTAAPALTKSAPATPEKVITPSPTPPERTKYQIDAVFDYARHELQVAEKIHYQNRSNSTLDELVLMVDPLYYPGVFLLNQITIDASQTITNPEKEQGWITIPLAKPIHPGKKAEISLDYSLALPAPVPSPDVRPVPFGYTERQSNFVDWYPFIPPYIDGQGWLAHPASYYGEHLVYENADFEINLQMANGRQDLVIAASAPGVQDGGWTRYTHQNARNFAWSVSPYYQVISQDAGGVTVLSYAFPGYQASNQAVLETTVNALKVFSGHFGPYPRQVLSVVQADFLDGMEYDGLFFLSKGFYNTYTGQPGEYLVAIAAHETAHQWWYGQVGNDQALEPWLDEALSTYSERLYYEQISPESLDWWWDYRVNYYEPAGWVNTTIYNPFNDPQPYLAYRNAVYLNGAVFLEQLRQLIGDRDFFHFLMSYAASQKNLVTPAAVFFDLLNQHTSQDVQPLVDEFFINID